MNEIEAYVERIDYVTNGELMNRIDGLCGDLNWVSQDFKLIYFAGVSELFIDSIEDLLRRKVVVLWVVDPFCLFHDGCPIPSLPFAKRERRYKRWHFLPTGIRHFRHLSSREKKAVYRIRTKGDP